MADICIIGLYKTDLTRHDRNDIMKVGLVTISNFPTGRQVRTEKIAKAIHKTGSDAVVFARNTCSDPARGSVKGDLDDREETLSYATVRRFSWLSSTRLFGLVTAPVPVNPLWILWLYVEFSRRGIDSAIAGDLRSGLPTIIAARLVGIPVVFDLRENYVGLAQALPTDSPMDHIVQNPTLVGVLETITIRLADEVWVVVDERCDQLLDRGVSPKKVNVISNTPELRNESETTPSTVQASTNSERDFEWPGFTLIYVGVINKFRGLDLILEAMAHLRREGNDSLHLAIAGEGPYRETLEQQTQRLGISDQVSFVGWLDPDRIPAFLESGDVGVIPHQVSPLTEYTIPNKLFDYMMSELPILTRNITPIRRIVEEHDCGYVLPQNATVSETAAQIRRLPNTDVSCMGQNGYDAVKDEYNWSADADRVRESLARLHEQNNLS